MSKKYSHFSIEEREIISKGLASGKSKGDIAKELGRSTSSIGRELKRNFSNFKKEYFPHLANNAYLKRKSKALKHKRLRSSFTRKYVVEKIKLGWSPEQISGRLKLDHPKYYVSHEAIYQFIYDPVVRGIIDLVPYLRKSHEKRKKKSYSRKTKRSLIPNRVPILERPKEVESRDKLGHWEGDSIVSSKSKAALNTLVERKSNLVLISKLVRKTANNTKSTMIKRLKKYPKEARETLTLDNGCEFTKHESVTKEIGTKVYFAQPYHSWERAINENTNGLIRWYFPKSTDFNQVTSDEIKEVEWLLNTRPRKRLNYRTPLEVFNENLKMEKMY